MPVNHLSSSEPTSPVAVGSHSLSIHGTTLVLKRTTVTSHKPQAMLKGDHPAAPVDGTCVISSAAEAAVVAETDNAVAWRL